MRTSPAQISTWWAWPAGPATTWSRTEGGACREGGGGTMMSDEEGRDLTRQVQAGRRAQQRLDTDGATMDAVSRRRLQHEVRRGQEAMATLLQQHERMVARAAIRATRGRGGDGMQDA